MTERRNLTRQEQAAEVLRIQKMARVDASIIRCDGRLHEHRAYVQGSEEPGWDVRSTDATKGKEFDGVVIVEGQYAGAFFNEKRERPPFAATRRLLRVGITRAHHQVVLVRRSAAPPLTCPPAADGPTA